MSRTLTRYIVVSLQAAQPVQKTKDCAESGCESDVVDELFLTPVSSSSPENVHQPHKPSGGFPQVNACSSLSVTNIDFAVAVAVTQCQM